ncbi:MAG: DUF3037 domain-containing protein [Gemmatimonadaceae bacterium]|nr:DUF3037 domain-containing protein [Gemmatimonadaceae bacterium]MBA3557212.1 DUF3037 domain-containing protein [Gemmatimonadaceae bacterium]
MSPEQTYFRYIVAQYVHGRRDEKLNVGVIVHDPLRAMLRSQFDVSTAIRRLRSVFPDVDTKAVRLYLNDLGSAILSHEGLNAVLEDPAALTKFRGEWQNSLQFTTVRSIPAATMNEALELLMRLYVVEVPAELYRLPTALGVRYARERTRQALKTVLQLEEGVGYRPFREHRDVRSHGKVLQHPVEFPFWVYERFLIDTISFRTDGFNEKLGAALGFVDKVKWLRARFPNENFQPCLSFTPDDKKPEETAALVARIVEEADVTEDRVAPAGEAERLAIYIRDRQQAA